MKKYILLFIICLVCVAGCVNPFGANTIQNSTKNVTHVITTIPVTRTIIPVVTPVAIKTVIPNVTLISNITQVIGNVSNLTVTFIDVGQGDSEWIKSPTGKTMLIDVGEENQVSKVTPIINKTINIVVATHPHSDHIGGMQTILTKYTIGEFFDSGYPYTSATYKIMLDIIDKKNISYTTIKTGDTIIFDPLVKIKVLNPQPKFFDDINDNSIVLLMTYKNVSFLFTGDAGLNAEDVYAKQLGTVTILKVAHHGSTTATGDYLLSKIHPNISIISVGVDNTYGHPDLSTINRLKNSGSKVYRTDQNGSISITTNGEDYSVISTK